MRTRSARKRRSRPTVLVEAALSSQQNWQTAVRVLLRRSVVLLTLLLTVVASQATAQPAEGDFSPPPRVMAATAAASAQPAEGDFSPPPRVMAANTAAFPNPPAPTTAAAMPGHPMLTPGIVPIRPAPYATTQPVYQTAPGGIALVPIKLTADEGAKIYVFGPGGQPLAVDNPATLAVRVGGRYWFAIDSLPYLPERRYGSIEVWRGFPVPPGVKQEEFPVPIHFNYEDGQSLRDGVMVTKVVALEDARDALGVSGAGAPIVYRAEPTENPLETAQGLGVPILVVRIGGRIPLPEELGTSGMVGTLFVGKTMKISNPTSGESREVVSTFTDAGTGQRYRPTQLFGANPATPVGGEPSRATAQAYPTASTSYHGGRAAQSARSSPPPHSCSGAGCATCLNHCSSGACAPTEPYGPIGAMGHPGHGSRNAWPATGYPVGPPMGGPNPMIPLPADDLGRLYVCDGGDARPLAGFNRNGQLINIEATETVAEYKDDMGGKRIAPSNRICIFAPRFLEVRQLTRLDGLSIETHASAANHEVAITAMQGKQREIGAAQIVQPIGVDSRKRASELTAARGTGVFSEVKVLQAVEVWLGWAQESGVIRPAVATQVDQALVAAQVQMALELTSVLSPQVLGLVEGVGEVSAVWKTQEYIRVEENPKKPGHLVVSKTASATAAKIGDEIVFVISYKNVGERPITHVAIVDNLSARLEYIAETAQSERPAVFTAELNDANSQILRWELKEPLKPGAEGAVRFKARVR